MASATTDISGALQRLERALGRAPAVRERALQKVMLYGEAVARDKYCPRLTGALARSITGRVLDGGHVGELRTNGLVYAAKQEFDLSLDHETPMNEGAERGGDYIGRATRDMVRMAAQAMQAAEKEVFGE